MTKRTSKKIKVAELFLSLGLVATLATGCEPAEEGGEAIEGDDTTIEEPVEDSVEEPIEESMEEPMEEEGGEGGED